MFITRVRIRPSCSMVPWGLLRARACLPSASQGWRCCHYTLCVYIYIYIYIKSIHVQMPTHKCITTNADMEPAVTIMNIAVNINSDIHNFGARIITVHLVIIHTHTARIATWRMYAGPRKRPACIESICPAPMLLETQLGDCALGSPGLSPQLMLIWSRPLLL